MEMCYNLHRYASKHTGMKKNNKKTPKQTNKLQQNEAKEFTKQWLCDFPHFTS